MRGRGKAAGRQRHGIAVFNRSRSHRSAAAVGIERNRVCDILPHGGDHSIADRSKAVAGGIFRFADQPRLEALMRGRGKAAYRQRYRAAVADGNGVHFTAAAVVGKADRMENVLPNSGDGSIGGWSEAVAGSVFRFADQPGLEALMRGRNERAWGKSEAFAICEMLCYHRIAATVGIKGNRTLSIMYSLLG